MLDITTWNKAILTVLDNCACPCSSCPCGCLGGDHTSARDAKQSDNSSGNKSGGQV